MINLRNTAITNRKTALHLLGLCLVATILCLDTQVQAQVRIKGNIYGGGKLGNVSESTSVTLKQSAAIVYGSVYGGGRGAEEDVDIALVGGSTQVLMSDGHVMHSVYGGGELGSIVGNTLVTLSGGKVGVDEPELDDGYVFGGGKGSMADRYLATVRGNTHVVMSGGYVHNTLFGGGEVASVGIFEVADAADAENDIVKGEPISCTSGGKTLVEISGGQIGLPAATLRNDIGYVFGASMGVYTQPDAEHTAENINLTSRENGLKNAIYGYVDSAEVRIRANAFIVGAVWAGSENGQVLKNSGVHVSGGQIGCGLGETERYDRKLWLEAEAAVRANDPSRINAIADKMPECEHWPYGRDTIIADNATKHYLPYDIYAYADGATDASGNPGDGHTFFGNVFAGGSGIYPYRISGKTHDGLNDSVWSEWYSFQGRVRGDTYLIISDSAHILTSAYGGCEISDVMGDCYVSMTGGTIGLPRSFETIVARPVSCNLYGAGKGDQRTHFNQYTNVRDVHLSVTGGTIFGSVFGGGEDGHILRDSYVSIGGDAWIGTFGTSYFDGNIFGGGRGFSGEALTAGSVGGNVSIDVTPSAGNEGYPHMLGSIYGGGRLASIGTYFVQPDNPKYGVLQEGDSDHGNITITISGGTIGNDLEYVYAPSGKLNTGNLARTKFYDNNTLEHTMGGNVYGGSMGRLTGLVDTTNWLWPWLAWARSTTITVTGGTIKSNVYGGGELGALEKASAITISGSTVIGTEVKDEGGNTIYTYGSVYGGGYGTILEEYEEAAYSHWAPPIAIAGRVEGNTSVTITGGQVLHSVYGGGEVASVGIHAHGLPSDNPPFIDWHNDFKVQPDGYEMNFDNTDRRYFYYAVDDDDNDMSKPLSRDYIKVTGGESVVTIGGTARIGRRLSPTQIEDMYADADHTRYNLLQSEGMVYGAGKGVAGLNYSHYTYVGSAEVNVLGQASILGSVFGGGENGHVVGNTGVTIGSTSVQGATDPNPGAPVDYPTIGRNVSPSEYFSEYFSSGSGDELYFGNVYGGGRGIDISASTKHHSLTAGRVEGNTKVTLLSGRITHNVYGGGSLASVGIDRHPYSGKSEVVVGDASYADGSAHIVIGLDTITDNNEAALFGNTADYYKGQSISSSVKVPDLTYVQFEASDPTLTDKYRRYYFRRFAGRNEGRVYGGGRGNSGVPDDDASREFTEMAFVSNAFVTINNGAKVRGSVFGGGENGHVRQNTDVKILGGRIGVPLWAPYTLPSTTDDGTTICDPSASGAKLMTDAQYYAIDSTYDHWESDKGVGPTIYRGNVYGGGRGVSPVRITKGGGEDEVTVSLTAGRVYSNATVNISGKARIYHHVYGGGSLASVGDTVSDIITADLTTDLRNEYATKYPNYTPEQFTKGDVFDILGYRICNPNVDNPIKVYGYDGNWLDKYVMPTDAEWDAIKGDLDGKNYILEAATDMGESFDEAEPDFAKKTHLNLTRVQHDYNVGSALYGTGIVTITVNGGIIGTNGINEGRIYGSGRGIAGDATNLYTKMAFTHNVNVNIEDGADIRGCVFGGGANGHVTQNTNVVMTGGVVGAHLTFEERRIDETGAPIHRIYRGNIYGGGRGVDSITNHKHLSQTAGRVYGNTRVEVTGGLVRHSIYGGGSLASVGTFELYDAAGDDSDLKHIYYRNSGVATVIVGGQAQVGPSRADVAPTNFTDLTVAEQEAFKAHLSTADIATKKTERATPSDAALTDAEYLKLYIDTCFKYIGTNEGMVFGSGRGVAAYGKDVDYDRDYAEAAFTRRTIVVVKDDAEIVGSVFGGGENGHVKGNTHVYIAGGIVGGIPLHGCTSIHHDLGSHSCSYTISDPKSEYDGLSIALRHDADDLEKDESELREDSHGVGRIIWRGNVYGGGRGVDHDQEVSIDAGFSSSAGRIYGNAHVTVIDGKIYHSVYGGGSVATVGTFEENTDGEPQVMKRQYNIGSKSFARSDYHFTSGDDKQMVLNKSAITIEDDGDATETVDGIYYYTTGLITTTIKGGEVGITGRNEGSVFGAGRGIAGTATAQVTHLAFCNATQVNIEGGTIAGSVFGGGADGHVLTDTKVNVSGGIVGTKLTLLERQTVDGGGEHIYRGNVYGGGRGVDPVINGSGLSQTAGRVYGNSEVVVTGGTIRHGVYGGGSLASVGTFDIVNYGTGCDDEYMEGKYKDVYPAEKSFGWIDMPLYLTHIYHHRPSIGEANGKPTGKATVTISGGRIGPLAEDLEEFTDDDAKLFVYTDGDNNMHYYTTTAELYAAASTDGHGIGSLQDFIDASYKCLGENEGSVYGSGRGVAYTKGENEVYAEMAFVKETEVNIEDGAFVVGSVFGGGENGHVRFDTHVNIKGGTIGGIPMHRSGVAFDPSATSFQAYAGVAAEAITPFRTGGSNKTTLKFNNQASLDEDELRENSTGTGRTIYRGNVYGGGRGVDHSAIELEENYYSSSAGRVYGNANINISGGKVYHHVYGGGSLASVGNYDYHETGINAGFPAKLRDTKQTFEINGLTYSINDIKGGTVDPADTIQHSVGNIRIVMTGGQLGFTGINEGRIYGAGRGIAGARTNEVTHLAYCNSTEVYVGCEPDAAGATTLPDDSKISVATTGTPDIRGNVFGGGDNGHVLADTRVVVARGTIGVPLSTTSETTFPYKDDLTGEAITLPYGEAYTDDNGIDATTTFRGNVYGGGRGVNPIGSTGNMSFTAGHVYGNTHVYVVGGTINHNIYGGGSLATVGLRLYKESASATEYTSYAPVLKEGTTDEYYDEEGSYKDNTTGMATIYVGGDAVVGTSGLNNGRVFGAGRGVASNDFDSRTYIRAAEVTIADNAQVRGSVFGGGENGHLQQDAHVTIAGNAIVGLAVTTSAPFGNKEFIGNVYGAGRGVSQTEAGNIPYHAGYVRGNTVVNIDGGTIYHNVYGGGSMALVGDYGLLGDDDYWHGLNLVDGAPDGTLKDDCWQLHGGTATVNVRSSVGSPSNTAGYGGNVYGSCRGQANNPSVQTQDLYGAMAYAVRTVVNIDAPTGTVYGSVYGGGQNGHVDFGGTTVYVKNGHIAGNVFGGGQGNISSPTAGIVDGPTQVHIGLESQLAKDSANTVLIDGSVFAGNDTWSSPLGDMRVDIWRTAHTANNEYPFDVPATEAEIDAFEASPLTKPGTTDSRYALHSVYGGGNLANVLTGDAATDDYAGNADNVFDKRYINQRLEPAKGTWPVSTRRKSIVYVHDCHENTIKYIYGGGRAASSRETEVVVEGGLVYQLYGGGNGSSNVEDGGVASNPGADVAGNVTVFVRSGVVHQVFGGSNSKGNVAGTINVNVSKTKDCNESITEVYGGGNEAEIEADLEVNVSCGTSFTTLYGGSNKAPIKGNVTLNVYGGTFDNVFGGSNQADIDGDVTLNIFGGNIVNAFGGNNTAGEITGQIIVNVDLDDPDQCGDLRLDNVYGGGNQADYNPTKAGVSVSPLVNIKHTEITNNVFGGGLEAKVEASPKVRIGGFDEPVKLLGNVFGGGSQGDVGTPSKEFTSTVVMRSGEVVGNIFGGGLAAPVHGDTRVDVVGISKVDGNVYGGGYEGTVTGTPDVHIGYTPTLTAGAPLINISYKGKVTLTSTTEGAKIYYTINGPGNPTTADKLYEGAFDCDELDEVQAIAVKDGMENSDVIVRIVEKLPAPTVSVNPCGEVRFGIKTGSKVYYTTDGSDPTISATAVEYTDETVLIPGPEVTTVKVCAELLNHLPSSITTVTRLEPPTYTIGSDGTTTLTSLGAVYYTTDGSDPRTSATKKYYTCPFHLDVGQTLRAVSTSKTSLVSLELSVTR